MFIEKLEVDKTECITVVDPEFALHINKLRYSNAEPLKNLIVAVGPWHLMKHMVENLLNDRVLLILLLIPLYYSFYGHQKDKKQKLYFKIVESMEKAIETYETKHRIPRSLQTSANQLLKNEKQQRKRNHTTVNALLLKRRMNRPRILTMVVVLRMKMKMMEAM